ncbi:MAG: hypothetical protein RQ756_09340 [Flavobacteriaceae bacterium]|nr:hypothetical protein [Flavobacteriaceae bacterium]
MKTLLIFFLVTLTSIAQVDRTFPRTSTSPNVRDYTIGEVQFTKSLVGLRFKKYIDPELRTKIEKFMQSNRYRAYRPIGDYTLKLAKKRDGKIYVIERERPDKLIPLD